MRGAGPPVISMPHSPEAERVNEISALWAFDLGASAGQQRRELFRLTLLPRQKYTAGVQLRLHVFSFRLLQYFKKGNN
jgi:hypothetical protein